jgi:hypothetical protein
MEPLFLTQEDEASNKNGKNRRRYLPGESHCGRDGVDVAGGVGKGLLDIAQALFPRKLRFSHQLDNGEGSPRIRFVSPDGC